MPTLSHAGPGGEVANCGHDRRRARTGQLRLGDGQTGADHRRLRRKNRCCNVMPRRSLPMTIHPKLGKAGGTVTARRTLVSTTSRSHPTLAF